MTRDQLDRLGSGLRKDLRRAVGSPPPLALLRRRHRQRVAARALVSVLALVGLVLVTLRVLPGPGVTIDPFAPPDPTAPPTMPNDLGAPSITPIDLPDPVDLRLLAARFNNPSLAIIDLRAGEARLHAPGHHGLPTQDFVSGAQLLSDGSVAVWQHDTLTVLPADLGAPMLVRRSDEYAHDTRGAFRVVPVLDEDALWVAQVGPGHLEDAVEGQVELVDIATGEVRMATVVPPDAFPVAATNGGLVMTTTGGWIDSGDGWIDDPDARVTLLVGDDGSVTSISPGWAIAAGRHVVAIQSCEGATGGTGCSGDLELLNVATRERTGVERPIEGDWAAVNTPAVPGDHAPWSATAPNGHLLVGIAQRVEGGYASHVDLMVIDPTSFTATPISRVDGKGPWPARWDQQGKHIVIADDRDLILIDVEAGTSTTLMNVIPEDHWVIAMR